MPGDPGERQAMADASALAEALKKARDSAHADAQRLNLALEAARLGDWSWDAATDRVTFSKRAADIFGVAPGTELTRTVMRDLLHPEDREWTRDVVEAAIATSRDYDLEYRLINGGGERWVLASGRAHYDETGRVIGTFGVVRDITSDRLLVHLDDAVRPLTDPAEITLTAARLLGTHLRVNRCAYATIDADEDSFDIEGNFTAGTHSIVGRFRFRQFGAACLALMRAGQPYVVSDSEEDARIDDADREAYRLTAIRAAICVPILKTGRFVAAMAVHSIGPREWTASEVALVQQFASRCWESIARARVDRERARLLEVAEEANRAKDEFLAMLGHELRNPLSPILTAVQLMKLRGDAGSERERTVIERQVRHLTRLVDDLLDVARIAQGKVKLAIETVDLADVVTRAIEMSSPLLEERSHILTLDVPPGLQISGDPARLGQVVSNLLTNACKYTPPHGRIAVSATVHGADIELQVRDSGVGIAADVLPRIFDQFFQGRQALDRSNGGLGLGLAIVRSLVERHGGQVLARSDGPGLGSEFVVRLPAARTAAERAPVAAPAAAPRQAAAHRAVLLVVDDNEDAAALLAQGLRMMGHEVHVAHDGLDALRLGAQHAFDAAFLDIGLPVMDGFELAARLRELPGFGRAHLIAVTGYGQESDRHRTSAAGFHDHLVKPVDLDAVERLIAGWSVP